MHDTDLIHERFLARVKENPAAIALVDGDRSTSYAELDIDVEAGRLLAWRVIGSLADGELDNTAASMSMLYSSELAKRLVAAGMPRCSMKSPGWQKANTRSADRSSMPPEAGWTVPRGADSPRPVCCGGPGCLRPSRPTAGKRLRTADSTGQLRRPDSSGTGYAPVWRNWPNGRAWQEART